MPAQFSRQYHTEQAIRPVGTAAIQLYSMEFKEGAGRKILSLEFLFWHENQGRFSSSGCDKLGLIFLYTAVIFSR